MGAIWHLWIGLSYWKNLLEFVRFELWTSHRATPSQGWESQPTMCVPYYTKGKVLYLTLHVYSNRWSKGWGLAPTLGMCIKPHHKTALSNFWCTGVLVMGIAPGL
jgi:hypothetical protein